MKAVEIVWYDAADISSWMSHNDMAVSFPAEYKGKLCRTRGWLYAEDEFKVILSMTWCPEVDRNDEEFISGNLAIPRGMVVEIIEQ